MSNPLQSYIDIQFLSKFNRIWVGFSGGVDSTALLHYLKSTPLLTHKVHAIHINHNLQKNAIDWEVFCKQFCDKLNIPITIVKLPKLFQNLNSNIEDIARQARFKSFSKHINSDECLLLAHHQQDQVETMLLNLFNGAGLEGLSAMDKHTNYLSIPIYRPLLNCPKKEILSYAKKMKIQWVEDQSNLDTRFKRNYIRHKVIPLLEQAYPGIENSLYRTSQLCRQSQAFIKSQLISSLNNMLDKNGHLCLLKLQTHSDFEKSQIIRYWLKQNNIQYPSKAMLDNFICALSSSAPDRHPEIQLGNNIIRRYNRKLMLDVKLQQPTFNENWEGCLENIHMIPDKYRIKITRSALNNNIYIPDNAQLKIMPRNGGEKILINGQHKKVKKLFQSSKIPPWQREFTPLIYINDQLAAVGNLWISDLYNTANNNCLLSLKD